MTAYLLVAFFASVGTLYVYISLSRKYQQKQRRDAQRRKQILKEASALFR